MTELDRIRMPTTASARLAFLQLEGYRPELLAAGSIRFHYRDAVYLLTVDETDPNYLRVAAPNIWSIDDPQEQIDALEVAADVQWTFKAVKVTVTGENTWVTSEGFLPDAEAFTEVFGRALFAVALGVRQFVEQMRARRACPVEAAESGSLD